MKPIYSFFIILTIISFVDCGPSTGGDDGLAILAALEEGTGSCIKASGDTSTTGTSPATTIVNATSSYCWAYLDLKAGGVETTSSGTWDLKFKRFVIASNSGTSGTGLAGVCIDTDATSLATVDMDCTLEVDELMSQTGGGGFGTATENASPPLWDWYDYNGTTHVLTAKDRYYWVQGSDGTSNFAVRVTNYYDNASTSGFPTIEWISIP